LKAKKITFIFALACTLALLPELDAQSGEVYDTIFSHGKCNVYFSNGHLKESGFLKNGHWYGEYKSYYSNDTLRAHTFTDSLGKKNGMQLMYWSNGELRYQASYNSGKELWMRAFYENGRLKRETFYEDSTHIIDYNVRQTCMRAPDPPLPLILYQRIAPPCDTNAYGFCEDGKFMTGRYFIYDDRGKLIAVEHYEDGRFLWEETIE
jgi:hypothetical protein